MGPHPASVTLRLMTCVEPCHQVPCHPSLLCIKWSSNCPWMRPKSPTCIPSSRPTVHLFIRQPVASVILPWAQERASPRPRSFCIPDFVSVSPPRVAFKEPLLLDEDRAGPPPEQGQPRELEKPKASEEFPKVWPQEQWCVWGTFSFTRFLSRTQGGGGSLTPLWVEG